MLDGVYEGVTIRPNTIADALVRMCQSHREHARIMEVALITASSLPQADHKKVAELYNKYCDVAYPPGANKGVQIDELVSKAVEDENWTKIEQQFRNTVFKARKR